MRNNLKITDEISERNAFRKIREEQAKKGSSNLQQANVLKNKMNTYSKIKPQDDTYLD